MVKEKGSLSKLGIIVTICATIIATTLSILSFIRDADDKVARDGVNKAKIGYSEHSKTIEDMAKDIRSNRELLMTLLVSRIRSEEGGSSTSRATPPAPRARIRVPKRRVPKMREQHKWKDL